MKGSRDALIPFELTSISEPLACDLRWPVPFPAAFISSVLSPGTHLLLGGQGASIQSRPHVGLRL